MLFIDRKSLKNSTNFFRRERERERERDMESLSFPSFEVDEVLF